MWDKLRGFIQAHGTRNLKRSLWNKEFQRGRWNCLDQSAGDVVYRYIERYANHGSILDLGCGSGSTGNELLLSAYQEYIGVDISDVAIKRAIVRTEANCRTYKNRFIQSDISCYVPTQKFDIIVLRDSLYYIPSVQIKGLLERYARFLTHGGVFIVRMWSAEGKYKSIVDLIESHFTVVERYLAAQSTTVIMVFRGLRD